jgi:hypothetical protein
MFFTKYIIHHPPVREPCKQNLVILPGGQVHNSSFIIRLPFFLFSLSQPDRCKPASLKLSQSVWQAFIFNLLLPFCQFVLPGRMAKILLKGDVLLATGRMIDSLNPRKLSK